ncbi:purine catabolism regulator [Mycobacterium sp. MAA66]|uniref:PucR family transcriptional regulator n=1 Tax=Mycobacterium sp. MAA66 TaxID=3156297 RepID=UPI0035199B0B
MALTVADVLAHPSLQAASPKVLSGATNLDHVVRWVHSTDLYDIAALLRGDEVLLTNGVGLVGVDDNARRRYVRQLSERGVAGLFFEVGRTFGRIPDELVQEAQLLSFPVVELAPALRFTEVAEAVNSELINQSVVRLRHADETSRTLSESLARGASLTELVDQVAIILGTWARVSDYAGRIAVESGTPTSDFAEAPVLVDGTVWGRLAIGPVGPAPVLCEAVLDRAPIVLGLCLIRERTAIAGALRAQHLVLEYLMANRPTDRAVLESRLRAAGLATTRHQYVCICVDPTRVDSAAQVADAVIGAVGQGIVSLIDGVLCGLLVAPATPAGSNLFSTVIEALKGTVPHRNMLCATVGRVVEDIAELPRAMAETLDVLRLPRADEDAGSVVSVRELALDRLLAMHGDHDALRQFIDDQLGALERADEARGGQLVRTVEALVACAGHKAEAAQRLHIRRQSLYYRLGQINRLLDADLDDPKQLTTLAVALTARRIRNVSR